MSTTVQRAFLHQTDLFRPHNDPDDHWDLACAFAIAKAHNVSLKGILIDYPPGPPQLSHHSDPDLGAVAQLSHLTNLWPPVAVGHASTYSDRDIHDRNVATGGVRFVLDVLKDSPGGLFISIVGSARDIAEAITREPGLFESNCLGIYLNVGRGTPNADSTHGSEWNVILDPAAYAKIFEAPCPIFWMPCLEDEHMVADHESREYATHYRFQQRDILDHLPTSIRNYFGWMFAKEASSEWLRALTSDFENILAAKAQDRRMMYSTAAFFDLAGLCVTLDGDILPSSKDRSDWVYQFERVAISCSADGTTRWKPAAAGNHFIFHVLDTKAYPLAMTRAMRELLSQAYVDAKRKILKGNLG